MAAVRKLISAVHTPFDAHGDLNLNAVDAQAELLIESGVAGAFPGGTTGESLSLTMEERLALAKRWVDVTSGTPLKVIIHVGHNSLPDAVTLAKQAEELGADGISAMPPCYFRPENVADLVECARIVAAAAPSLPFYYYDIPPMTNVRLPMVEFIDRAVETIPTLAGIKYSNMDLVQLQGMLRAQSGRMEILFGSDEAIITAWTLGVRGAVGSTYNFLMPVYHRLLDAFDRGDLKEAAEEQFKSVQVVRRLQQNGFLPASKALMGMLGVDCGPIHLPMRNLTEAQLKSLYEDLQTLEGFFPRPLNAPQTALAGRT